MSPNFTIPEMHAYLRAVFPQHFPASGGSMEVAALGADAARLRMRAGPAELRPGGTVSGPAIFALADCAFYVAVLAALGREALAVTTSVSLDFMRKAGPGLLEAEARILKRGRALVVGDVMIAAESVAGPVARASLTYSIPPRSGG
jgi:uncharacterized protein (TIGR00369 family)